MQALSLERVNHINIGLMLFSCVAAFIVPFELFLFAYAVLGPLHYLTEISWLHDRSYFTRGKHDYMYLVGIGILLMASQYWSRMHHLSNGMIYLAFLSALVLILVRNNVLKIFGILLILATYKIADNFLIFFSVFLPTLIHVFVFTGCFILFGALKSRSKSGMWSFAVFLLCPLSFFLLFTDQAFIDITAYGREAYEKFHTLNYYTLSIFFNEQFANEGEIASKIYHSQAGLMIMRFIAFAYMYHYLNWFSKTSVIKWHEVPRARLLFVVGIWILSVVLYSVDYALGFEWLFFLSFLHVFLEFPLNHLSFIGIGKEIRGIVRSGSFAPSSSSRAGK